MNISYSNDQRFKFKIFSKPTYTGVVIDNLFNHPVVHKLHACNCYLKHLSTLSGPYCFHNKQTFFFFVYIFINGVSRD